MNEKQHISSFSVILVFVCLTIVGLAMIPKLSVKLAPSQSLPQVNVNFSMYGSSPRMVEMEVTSKLEAMFNRMSGVQEISSNSGSGWGQITIRFDKHRDMETARFEVSTLIRQLWPLLPSNVSYPTLSLNRTDDKANRPFLSYTVNAPTAPLLIQQYTEKQIKPKLSQIEGIYRSTVSGATSMEWQLVYDYKQLVNMGIRIQDIQNAISKALDKNFLGLASVESDHGNRQWIRLVLTPELEQQGFSFDRIEVKNLEGRNIALKDLVQIHHVESQPQSYYRINGLNSIYLSLYADEQVNQLSLSRKIKDKVAEIESNLPPGYEIHLSYDATEYIQTELNKIYFRSALTLAILLLFVLITYRSWRYTLLIVLSLFISLCTAIIFYFLLGLEIQLYSLAGITISLTLIIDNTIVVSDQIIRRKNNKAFLAILTATSTTIVSLSVIFFLEEKIRLNLQDFALVIMINLAISLAVALFLVPALLDKLRITGEHRRTEKRRNFFSRRKDFLPKKVNRKRLAGRLNRAYASLCRFMYRKRALFLVLLILAFGLPVFLLPDKLEKEEEEKENRWQSFYNKTLGSATYKENIKPYVDKALGGTLRLFAQKVHEGSYFADREETSLFVTASLPSNATITQMNDLIKRMETYISRFPEVKQFQTNIYNARQADISIHFTKEHQRSSFPFLLKSKIISRSLELGGGSWSVYGLGDGFSNDVRENAGSYRVTMYGPNYDELYLRAEQFKSRLLGHRRIKEVIINSEFSWYKDDYEEFKFELDKERLAQENIQPYQLYDAIRTAFGQNLYSGQLPVEEGMESIYLYSRQSREYDIWNLYNIPLKINQREYKLSELAEIIKTQAPQKVAKINQQYRLCLQYEYIGANEQGKKVLDRNIEEFSKTLPMGYTIEKDQSNYFWWGEKDKKQYLLLPLIFLIIYFTTSILFNSLKQPFHIMSVIPISFIGIFLTFYLFDLTFDQGGFASFILLSGITINANIYILDEYNNIRKQYRNRITPLRAYLKAWNAKLSPIFLTITSTIFGFIPFLIGEYKEAFWFPLAAGTIGGLVISFFATFFFLPLFMGVGRNRKLPFNQNSK